MSEARVNRAACRMCVCLMCRCVLSAEPLPWCFSPAAPLRITGRWEPAGAAPRAARVEAERFHAVKQAFPEVRKHHCRAIFKYENDEFTKTGSGQT